MTILQRILRFSPLVIPFLTVVSASLSADQLAPSARLPGGLAPAQAPQFILLGFDDNQSADPMTWFVDQLDHRRNPTGSGQTATFDGSPVRMIFFSNGTYWKDPVIATIHRRAAAAGHELANHTQTHPFGISFTAEKWREEMEQCDQTYIDAGVLTKPAVGFRAPYLQYTDNTFRASVATGRIYDASIQEGYQTDQDGTNFLWPYTLDQGSPGNVVRYDAGSPRRLKDSYPGLWEIPMHVFILPVDDECERYGIAPGLRQRMQANVDPKEDNPASGKITGLDWNVLESARVSGPEFLAILKHNLDLRLTGNHAPFMVAGHTSLYPGNKPERRRAIMEFITYALSKPEVRFVTSRELIEWLRKPTPLTPKN
jgi:peptidoglycan/xylan/chitin deacetylase (PgdA/CDA1 family)